MAEECLLNYDLLVPIIRNEINSQKRIKLLKQESNTIHSAQEEPQLSIQNPHLPHFKTKEIESIPAPSPPMKEKGSEDIKSLINQMNAMSFAIKRIEERSTYTHSTNKDVRSFRDHSKPKCAYCDSDHLKRDCTLLNQDIEIGLNLVNSLDAKRRSSNNPDRYSPYSEKKSKSNTNTPGNNKQTTRRISELPKVLDPADDTDLTNSAAFENDKVLFEQGLVDKPYKIKSNIVESKFQDRVLERCKSSKLEISLQELSSVSPMIRKSLNDDLRPKRVVIAENITTTQLKPLETSAVQNDWKTEYLAVGSGKINSRIQGAEVQLLFDEGCEINLMSTGVFQALKSLGKVKLGESINWNLVDANQGSSKMLGVCNDVEIEIYGVAVRVSLFVSDYTKNPVILGRPWYIRSRVLKDKRADGSLWYTIRDEVSDAAATFCVNDKRDQRRFKNILDSEISIDVNLSQIVVCVLGKVNIPEHNSEVLTRYKSVNNKLHPVSKALKESKSPSILDEDKIQFSTKKRLTPERLNDLVIGNDNLTPEEVQLFKAALEPCDRAFAFKPEEMGILSTQIEGPIKVETVDHVSWLHKPYPVPKGIQ
ncbi:hypothetical protein AYI69_g3940 [Smittium culicis]|uniref:Peptidase A2 domain-containing protein n=1 Tax=Smittium culicis TaxID=133412 RepID=A0A1R1YIA7_9FUNG|nr:hypothetical protein AYI69_g3940 [Smittium culicis]